MGNYVCSDIHGLGERYSKMLNKYATNNNIYIIGDAIDNRYPGEEGIRILFDIMNRDNVKLIMGNHELMFIDTVGFFYTLLQRGFSESQAYDLCLKDEYGKNWLIDNHGLKTFEDFLKLADEYRKKIYSFLTQLPVARKLEILEHKFYLVHASPIKQKLQNGKEVLYDYQGETLLANDLLKISRKALYDAVWAKYDENNIDKLKVPKTHVIIGHTPTIDGKIKYYGKDELIVVDCDSKNAYQYKDKPMAGSNLGILSLEDKAEDYIHEI